MPMIKQIISSRISMFISGVFVGLFSALLVIAILFGTHSHAPRYMYNIELERHVKENVMQTRKVTDCTVHYPYNSDTINIHLYVDNKLPEIYIDHIRKAAYSEDYQFKGKVTITDSKGNTY